MIFGAEIYFLVFNEPLPPHVERFYQSLPPTKLVILSDTQPRILQFSTNSLRSFMKEPCKQYALVGNFFALAQ